MHDFGGVIVFISINRDVKWNSTNFREEDLHIGRTLEEG